MSRYKYVAIGCGAAFIPLIIALTALPLNDFFVSYGYEKSTADALTWFVFCFGAWCAVFVAMFVSMNERKP